MEFSYLLPRTPALLSLLRIVAGLLFFEHGTTKGFDFPHGSGLYVGLAAPSMLGISSYLDLIGGMLILVGLFTRITAFLLSGEMAVAYFFVHASHGFYPILNNVETSVLYCFIFLFRGGAMFCLLADVEIRRKIGNKMGLETALRTIIDQGGSLESDWPLSRVLATGDEGIGQPILESLYARLKDSSAPVDLQALWQQLGVEDRGGVVVFHDDAPLAGVRKAITAPQLE